MAEYICPHCRKPIYDDDALLCLYCGESLRRRVGGMGRLKYPAHKVILAAVVLLVVLSFILLIIKSA